MIYVEDGLSATGTWHFYHSRKARRSYCGKPARPVRWREYGELREGPVCERCLAEYFDRNLARLKRAPKDAAASPYSRFTARRPSNPGAVAALCGGHRGGGDQGARAQQPHGLSGAGALDAGAGQ